MGRVLGQFHPVRVKPRDSLYILFNTETHLYMIRADGAYADRYPMRFPARATNGITLLENNRLREYRVLVALQDNHVYNFTLRGNSVQEWERPGLNEEILLPINHPSNGRADLLIIEGKQGTTLITDRQGKEKIRLSPRFTHSANSGFFANRSLKKGALVTSDPGGKVLFIQENGKTTEVTLNLFSPAHYFFYEDINGNGSPEFIFFDRNNLYYYSKSYKLIYSYAFRREVLSPPFVVRAPGSRIFFGMVAPETSELYLFDQNGFRELGPGIRGNTPFEIGHVAPEGMMNLVVGSGKYVKNYRLTKFQQ
jgi:hypothetical protein